MDRRPAARRLAGSPLLACAGVLALASAPGFRLGSTIRLAPPSLALCVLLAGGLAVSGYAGRVRGSRKPVLFSLSAIGVAAFGIGVSEGSRLAGSCVASLSAGAPVAAAGVPERGPPATGENEVMVMGRAALVSDGRICRPGRIRIRVTEAQWAAGNRVLVRGSWHPYPGDTALRPPARAGYVRSALVAVSPEPPEGPAGRIARSLLGVRLVAAERLEARLPGDVAAAARALVLADRSGITPEVRRTFADAGLVHLLAISGFHIGLIAAGLLACLSPVRDRRRRHGVCVVATGAYVLWIGAPASAVRALAMFALWCWTRVRETPARITDVGGLAFVIVWASNPSRLLDPGLQLSFAGAAGVVLGMRAASAPVRHLERFVHRRCGRRPERLAGLVVRSAAVSLGATLLTAPIAALHFSRIAPASVVSSPFGAALVGLAIPALAAVLLLPSGLGEWPAGAATLLLRALDTWAEWMAALPLHATTPAFGTAEVVVALLLCALVVWARGRRPSQRLILAGIGLAGWLALPAWRGWAAGSGPMICTLDVGQGDAAVIRTSSGRWLVLDAGPGFGFRPDGGRVGWMSDPRYGDAGRATVTPFLRRRGVRTIELLAVSHPHLDHFGGAAALLDAFRVRRVLDPGFPEPSPEYARLLEAAQAERALWVKGIPGQSLTLDDVRLTVLWPPEERALDGANENSLVLRVEVGGLRYLNPGDAGMEAESALLDDIGVEPLSADILKLGHHGSRFSTSDAWIDAVDPDLVVISAGRENRYGHPHPETLGRLEEHGVTRVWRTDRDGTLCVAPGPAGGWSEVER